MKRLAVLALSGIYLALAPLCLADAQHAPSHAHASHAGMHMASDNVAASLSYHTDMYRSFTTATLASLLALVLALVLLVCAPAMRQRFALAPSTMRHAIPRYAPSPPDPLFARIALFTHAPPRSA